MGNPKQKWTAEEEQALKDGVAKHGPGKWKCIQKDPEFNKYLHSRSNIDLKDKWRNMSVAVQGSSTRLRTPRPKLAQNPAPVPVTAPPVNTETPVLPVAHEPLINHVKDESAKDLPDTKNGSRYNNDTTTLIFEALSAAKEQNGLDIGSIFSYIEQSITIEMPQNFRKQLGAKLRRLVQQEKLEKVENCYRLKSSSSLAETNTSSRKEIWLRQPMVPAHLKIGESLEEAAKTAAYKVAEAEEKSYFAALSVREAERLSLMQEEADAIYQLAQEILERCHKNEVLVA